ncbi:MAG: cation:proton antiporter [Acidimicrobiia bacterium]
MPGLALLEMPLLLAATSSGRIFVELGVVLLVLAIVGRVADRLGLPSIPLYLVAGLLLGEGSALSLEASAEFIRVGADVGVVMLLLLLGLEYSPEELRSGLRSNWPAGLIDLLANFPIGMVAGLLLGWDPLAAVLLGGVTYVSSSGIIAKVLSDLGRIANRETSVVLSVLVIEDIAMAIFLPIAGVLIVGVDPVEGALSVLVSFGVVGLALLVSARYGPQVSRLLESRSEEVLLLTVLGLTMLVAGLAEEAQVSGAVGAFLLGVTLSGQVAERGRELLEPIRDVFGGLFFVFFGLQIDPGTLLPVLLPALALAVATASTKLATGWWAAARAGIGQRGRVRAAISLIPRGEFSIVIAGIGVAAGLDADLGPLAACYVLILAVTGSVAMRFADLEPQRSRRRAGVRGRQSNAAANTSA